MIQFQRICIPAVPVAKSRNLTHETSFLSFYPSCQRVSAPLVLEANFCSGWARASTSRAWIHDFANRGYQRGARPWKPYPESEQVFQSSIILQIRDLLSTEKTFHETASACGRRGIEFKTNRGLLPNRCRNWTRTHTSHENPHAIKCIHVLRKR
jgi:hypothetical protein